MKGYKMVQKDYTDFRTGTVKYVVGTSMVHPDPDQSGKSCAAGYHVSKEPYGPLEYNARYPWRLLEVTYLKKDVIHDNGDKVRVSKLKVVNELKPYELGFPNAKRVYGIIKRTQNMKLRKRTKQAEVVIQMLVREHVDLLNKRHDGNERVILNGVKFHSLKQWDSVGGSVRASIRASVRASIRASVRDSVWDSVWGSVWNSVWASVRDSVRASIRASVRDSVRDSVWDSVWNSVWASVRDSIWDSIMASMVMPNKNNPFLPLLEIVEQGAVFHNIDKKGYAHISMPSANEVMELDSIKSP